MLKPSILVAAFLHVFNETRRGQEPHPWLVSFERPWHIMQLSLVTQRGSSKVRMVKSKASVGTETLFMTRHVIYVFFFFFLLYKHLPAEVTTDGFILC